MQSVLPTLPRDAEQRRHLWREWIHTDAPAITTTTARRTTAPSRPDWLAEAIDAPAPIIAGLATAVRESLVGDRLPHGDRQRLIARACRLGLNRFEANLLIAAVVHRAAGDARTVAATRVRSERRIWPVVLLVVSIEIVLGGTAWYA